MAHLMSGVKMVPFMTPKLYHLFFTSAAAERRKEAVFNKEIAPKDNLQTVKIGRSFVHERPTFWNWNFKVAKVITHIIKHIQLLWKVENSKDIHDIRFEFTV